MPIRSPATGFSISAAYSGTAKDAEVESFESCPAITDITVAASVIFVANGPIRSSEEAKAMRPYRDTRPYVGIVAGMPQYAPGWRIDPPVSVPRATTDRPAATAAADPPLEPPGTRSGARGLRTAPYAEFSLELPIANSSQLVLPRMTAPAPSRRSMAVASYAGI